MQPLLIQQTSPRMTLDSNSLDLRKHLGKSLLFFIQIYSLDSLKYDYDRLNVNKGYLSTKIIGLQKYMFTLFPEALEIDQGHHYHGRTKA